MNRKASHLGPILAALTFLLSNVGVARSQGFNEARKYDEFSSRELSSDDVSGRLYQFAQELLKNSQLRGYIVGYSEPSQSRGDHLRHTYGVERYVEDHGLDPRRVTVIDGGFRDRRATELWFVPEGASPPKPARQISAPSRNPSKAYLFDDACVDCEPAVNIDLHILGEGLEFYAKALREEARSRAYIVSYPNPGGSRGDAAKTANQLKKLLVNKYGIRASRVVIMLGSRRKDNAEVECWIVPGAAPPPKPKNRGL